MQDRFSSKTPFKNLRTVASANLECPSTFWVIDKIARIKFLSSACQHVNFLELASCVGPLVQTKELVRVLPTLLFKFIRIFST